MNHHVMTHLIRQVKDSLLRLQVHNTAKEGINIHSITGVMVALEVILVGVSVDGHGAGVVPSVVAGTTEPDPTCSGRLLDCPASRLDGT